MNTPRPKRPDWTVVRNDVLPQDAGAVVNRSPHENIECAPIVIKIGGRALEGAARDLFARELATLGAPVVLVHGGGAEVSAWSARLGIEPRFHDGLRVTDAATLDVVTAVLGGLENKRWVALLQSQGVDATGGCAMDFGIEVVPHRNAEVLGAVGEVRGVDAAHLRALLGSGFTPVLASLGASQGALLNVNADDLAAAVAPALGARALVLLSDVPALLLGGKPVARLHLSELPAALASPDVQGGMRPKLAAAGRTLEGGVPSVMLGAWAGPGSLIDLLEGRGTGTRISVAKAAVPLEVLP